MKDRMIQVVNVNGKYDYVKKSFLPYLIRSGYVVAIPWLEDFLTLEVLKFLKKEGIETSYDLEKNMFVAKPKE